MRCCKAAASMPYNCWKHREVTVEFEVNHKSCKRNQKAVLRPHSWAKNAYGLAEMLEKNKRNLKRREIIPNFF